MTYTKVFIEKAIEGGWEAFGHCSKECVTPCSFAVHEDGDFISVLFYEGEYPDEGSSEYDLGTILLDPLAWQAVGKVEEWNDVFDVFIPNENGEDGEYGTQDEWLWKWHRMLDALAEGKTVEEYIATLFK